MRHSRLAAVASQSASGHSARCFGPLANGGRRRFAERLLTEVKGRDGCLQASCPRTSKTGRRRNVGRWRLESGIVRIPSLVRLARGCNPHGGAYAQEAVPRLHATRPPRRPSARSRPTPGKTESGWSQTAHRVSRAAWLGLLQVRWAASRLMAHGGRRGPNNVASERGDRTRNASGLLSVREALIARLGIIREIAVR